MSKANTQQAGQPTFQPVDAVQGMAEYLTREDTDGTNQHVGEFLSVADFVMQNVTTTFSIVDFIALSRGFDLNPIEVESLFKKWTTKMKNAGKIKPIPNFVYDKESYVVIA